MRGCALPFKLIRRRRREKVCGENRQPVRFFLTSSLTALPSTLLAGQGGHHRFHHTPMSFADVAPVSAIAAVTARANSSGWNRRRGVFLQLGELRRFLVHQILPPGGAELIDRIAPLFQNRRENLLRLRARRGRVPWQYQRSSVPP